MGPPTIISINLLYLNYMKKTILLSPLALLLIISPVLAANIKTDSVQVKNSSVKSVNQIGEVVTETSEVEVDSEPADADNDEVPPVSSPKATNSRSQNAIQHMSVVAQSVKTLLETRISGGIGEQIREIAQQQNQSQEQIKQNLDDVESRPGWFKKLFGADKKTIRNLNEHIEKNQLRLEQLAEIQTQLSNQSDQQTVQLAVETLTGQNTALQQVLEEEEQIKGIFSWLTSLFGR